MTDEQIIEALATKVMGWWSEPGYDDIWRDPTTRVIYFKQSNPPVKAWNPLTNPADSKMVREKLAERFAYSLSYIHSLQGR